MSGSVGGSLRSPLGGPILAFDASAAACTIAIRADGRSLAWRDAPMARGHAETLMPLVMAVMAEAGLAFAALAKIAVGVGPGSFTGIRIALAAARGVGLAANRPVVGIDSFSAIAAAIAPSTLAGRSLLVIVDSKRAELFGQYFDADHRALGEPLILTAEAMLQHRPAGALLIAGDAAGQFPPAPDASRAEGAGRPDARDIARLAEQASVLLEPRPLYLRAADVTLPVSRRKTAP
jgi:tRNA threonylcarbamoyladenosine biosynthesis protein TsaB